jgi:hypothetical protein
VGQIGVSKARHIRYTRVVGQALGRFASSDDQGDNISFTQRTWTILTKDIEKEVSRDSAYYLYGLTRKIRKIETRSIF